jgi:hypothetical protein
MSVTTTTTTTKGLAKELKQQKQHDIIPEHQQNNTNFANIVKVPNDETVTEFEEGDRVMIVNIHDDNQKLNGQHGTISLEGGKLKFTRATTQQQQQQRNNKGKSSTTTDNKIDPNNDNNSKVLYSIHLDRLSPVGIHIGIDNIQKVPPILQSFDIVPVQNNVLQSPSGLLLLNSLNLFRWYIANKYFHDTEVNQLHDAMKMNVTKKIQYNRFMIDNWNNNRSANIVNNNNITKNIPRVYIDLFQFIYSSNQTIIHPQQRTFLVQAFSNIRALKYWNTGFQHDLWFIGSDSNKGYYVIPDCNLSIVYCIIGLVSLVGVDIKSNQHSTAPLSMMKVPIKVPSVTVLPWFGRLIYDTAATGIADGIQQPEKATEDFAMKLHAVVLKSIKNHTIIHCLTELELQQQQHVADADTHAQQQSRSVNEDMSHLTIRDSNKQQQSIPNFLPYN